MLQPAFYGMVFGGAALMIHNIYSFVQYARHIRGQKGWKRENKLLSVPIVLLVLFLIGYVLVGMFGNPDLIVGGILFGGSIFVFIMYKLLNSITLQIMENERREAKLKTREESDRIKTAFLAGVSHEMRTPLNVILGLDTLALKQPDLPGETREQLEKIGLSAKHMLGLVNNLLEMNGLESSLTVGKKEEFLLQDALNQVNAVTQPLCDEKGLEYIQSFPYAANARYIGNETQIREVLLSILGNAVKYTDAPGTVRFRVEIMPTGEETHLCRFIVSDTGVGIDPEFLPRIFEPFTQEDDSFTNRFGGSGLSLAVTKKAVELMGGTITARSEKGKGSVFTVTVPLLKGTEQETASEEKEPAGDEWELEPLEGKRILIVEDLPENAEIVQDLLELEGAETEHAENGQIAVEMVEKSAPDYYDAILMDLRMPVMDGLEATRRIRALDRPDVKAVPIIALTANAYESEIKSSLEAGMNEHLAKPADADMLYGTLRRHITQRHKAEAERKDAQ